MNWTRSILAIFGAGIASSLTDWFFMGDLLYKTANKHPEIWGFAGGVENQRPLRGHRCRLYCALQSITYSLTHRQLQNGI
jgi:hypothetical protein